MTTFRNATWALVAGALFATAAPPTNCYPALWLGMAALAWLGESEAVRCRREGLSRPGLRVALLGLAFGTGANVVAFRFLPQVIRTFTDLSWPTALLALLLLAIGQAVRWGAATWLHEALVRRGVASAWAFASGIYVGTFVPAVFPWSPGGGVTPLPSMVQLAELVGERGVTFLMAVSAGLLASAVTAFRARTPRAAAACFAAAAGLPLFSYAEGSVRMAAIERLRAAAPIAHVALVQPYVDARDRWDAVQSGVVLGKLTRATARAERKGAELTVWPEAAYPYPVGHPTRRCPIGPAAMLPLGVRGPVLAGLVMTGANGDLTNSVAVCSSDGALSIPQDKVHLLWFGETIPWLDRLPWVRARFTRGVGLVAGEAYILQSTGRVHASVLNCFEDTLPDAGRQAMTPRPNLLVNVTNDAWFHGSAESELHLRLAALRAVESRRDLVRAVNEGVTSWIDAAGVVRARTEGPLRDVLMADAALLETSPTPFDRFGDVPLATLLAASIALALARARRA